MRWVTRLLTCSALLLGTAGTVLSADIYVTPGGTGSGTIASPTNLQAALTAAASNAQSDVIYLKKGTYSASTTFTYDVTGDAGDVDASVTLSGGWGAGFTTRTEDPALTVLTGDDSTRVLLVDAGRSGRTVTFRLERLTVTNGYVDTGSPEGSYGAGLLGLADTSTPGSHGILNVQMEDCVFREQTNAAYGAAIYLTGSLVADGCTFAGNDSSNLAGAVYARIYNGEVPDDTIPAIFTDCEFRDNTAYQASAVRVEGNALTLQHCLVHQTAAVAGSAATSATMQSFWGTVIMDSCEFRNNVVGMYASAIDLLGAKATIVNSLFENNHAGAGGIEGGGVITGWNYGGGAAETVTVANCTFYGNTFGPPGYSSILDLQSPQTAAFTNCILWQNDVPAVRPQGSTYTLRNSDIMSGFSLNNFQDAGNNKSDVPQFADTTDYHLSSGTPCVDAGDNAAIPTGTTEDFEGDPRIFSHSLAKDAVVDMGWDEFEDAELNFTTPANGAFWLNNGVAKNITWVCQNLFGNVDLYLWKGERFTGYKYLPINTVPCSDQAYSWTIPADLADATDYAIAMDSLEYPTIGHGTGVTIQHLRLTAPNGGQSLRQGTTAAIKWVSGNLGAGATVRIRLYKGTTAVAAGLPAAAPNTGTYSWKIPYTLAPSGDYRLRITTTSPYASDDWSDAAFSIVPAVTVTSPNGGQVWKRGTAHPITWSYTGSPGGFVRIDLYRGGVLSRNLVASAPRGAAGKGSWTWNIPTTLPAAANYTIRIRSTIYTNCFDFSNAAFRITN